MLGKRLKMIIRNADVHFLDDYIDNHSDERYRIQPLANDWARISKIAEELGEVTSAFIGVTGQNPRKGGYGTYPELFDELADTAIACIVAIQHFTKDTHRTSQIVQDRMAYRRDKALVATPEKPATQPATQPPPEL